MEQPSSLPAKLEESVGSTLNSSVESVSTSVFSDATTNRSQVFMSDFAEATKDLLLEESAVKRTAAARKLARLGQSSASPHLIAALFDRSPEVRQVAVESLGQIGDSAAIGPLQELLARELHGEVPELLISEAIGSIAAREVKLAERESMESNPVHQNNRSLHSANSLAKMNAEPNAMSAAMTEAEFPFAAQEERLRNEEAAVRRAEQDLERRRAEAERFHQAEEEKQRLTAFEANRRNVESAGKHTTEKEQKLAAEIEALRKAGAEQLKRIEEANAEVRRRSGKELRQWSETDSNEGNTKDPRRSADLKVEASNEEAEAKLLAQKKARDRVEGKARRHSDEHVRRLAELEIIRSNAEAVAQKRAQTEQRLGEEIEALRKAEAETRRRAEEEVGRLAQLEAVYSAAEAESMLRTGEEQRLNAKIEVVSKVAAEQIKRMEEAKARLSALEETRHRAETKVRQRAEREIGLQAEIEALRQAELEQVKRIEEAEAETLRLSEEEARLRSAVESRQRAQAEARERVAEEARLKAESEARGRAEEEEQRLKKLETIRSQAEAEAQSRAEKEELLRSELEILSKVAAEKLKRIEKVAADLRKVEEKARQQSEEEARLTAAREALQKAEMEARRKAVEKERARAQAEARARAEEEEKRLKELEVVRSKSEAEAQQRSEAEQQLNAGIDVLRKAEAKQLKRMEEAQAETRRLAENETRLRAEEEARVQAETKARQRAIAEQLRREEERMQQQAQEEQQLVAQLEAIRGAAEIESQHRAEKIQRLNAEAEAFRKVDAEYSQRIEEAKVRLREVEAEARRKSKEEEQRLDALEAVRSKAAAKADQLLERELQLNEDIRALNARIEEAEVAISAGEEVRQAAETEMLSRAIEEERQLDELQAVRRQAEAELQLKAKAAKQLKNEIGVLRKAEAKRVKEIKKLEASRSAIEAEVRKLADQEVLLLTELASIRGKVDLDGQAWAQKELSIKAEIEALRKAETIQLKRIEKVEARLRAQLESRQAAPKAQGRSAKAKTKVKSGAKTKAGKRAQEEKDWVVRLAAIRDETALELKQRTKKVRLLHTKLKGLYKAEVEQLKRIEEAKARVRVQEEALQAQANEEAHLLMKGALQQTQVGLIPVNEETIIPKPFVAGQRFEAEIDAAIESLRPVETWQFAVNDDVEDVRTGREEADQQTQAIPDYGLETEAQQSDTQSDSFILEGASPSIVQHTNHSDARSKEELGSVSNNLEPEPEPFVVAETASSLIAEGGNRAEGSATEEIGLATNDFEPEPEPSVVAETASSLIGEGAHQADGSAEEEVGLVINVLQSQPSILEATDSPIIAEHADQANVSVEEEIDLAKADWLASTAPEPEETAAPESSAKDFVKSIDLVQMEKGIQTSGEEPSIVSALADCLRSGDPAERAAALQKLAQLDHDHAFSLITNLFDESSANVRNGAARALYEFKPDRAASFTRALREGSAERRRRIAAALDGSGLAAEAINSLAGESREKTYDAFSILFLMAKAGEVQSLVKTIETHPNPAVQLSVIKLLTFSNQPDIIPAFRSLAVRGSIPPQVRSALMESINEITNNARENARSAG